MLGHTASELAKVGQSEMANLVDVQNTGIVPTYYADHPATKMLVSISTGWPDLSKTASGVPTPRNFVLIVEDMQVEYTQYVDYVLPNAEKLVTLFRELGLPIVWTKGPIGRVRPMTAAMAPSTASTARAASGKRSIRATCTWKAGTRRCLRWRR